MVLIREDAFAELLEERLQLDMYDLPYDDILFDSTLRTCKPNCPEDCYRCPGINFDYTGRAATILLSRAFRKVRDPPKHFSEAIAGALQTFAHGFEEPKNHMCYPHFLLHGIELDTLGAIVTKIENNARIMHETRVHPAMRTRIREELTHDLMLRSASCDTEDHGGICHFTHCKDVTADPSHNYLAKFSVFLDQSNKTVYGLTVQGQTTAIVRTGKGQEIRDRKRGRAYFRLAHRLGKDPRTHVIELTLERLRAYGFNRVKVLRPNAHPYKIEKHFGFIGKYENVIRAAGITQENGIYLEADLILPS